MGLGGIVYGLIESSLVALVVGAAALVAFGLVEARSRSPMLPPALFRSRTFVGANLLTLFLYGALGGVFFFLPLDLIQVQGYSATAAGAATLPFILLMFLLGWSGAWSTASGPGCRWCWGRSSPRPASCSWPCRRSTAATGAPSSRPWSCSGSAWRSASHRSPPP